MRSKITLQDSSSAVNVKNKVRRNPFGEVGNDHQRGLVEFRTEVVMVLVTVLQDVV